MVRQSKKEQRGQGPGKVRPSQKWQFWRVLLPLLARTGRAEGEMFRSITAQRGFVYSLTYTTVGTKREI